MAKYAYPLVIALFAFNSCRQSQGSVRVTVIQSDTKLEVANGKIQLILSLGSTRVKQEYFSSSGNGWKLLASSFFSPEKTDTSVIPLYKTPDKNIRIAKHYRR
jgi:hypothetical protein